MRKNEIEKKNIITQKDLKQRIVIKKNEDENQNKNNKSKGNQFFLLDG